MEFTPSHVFRCSYGAALPHTQGITERPAGPWATVPALTTRQRDKSNWTAAIFCGRWLALSLLWLALSVRSSLTGSN